MRKIYTPEERKAVANAASIAYYRKTHPNAQPRKVLATQEERDAARKAATKLYADTHKEKRNAARRERRKTGQPAPPKRLDLNGKTHKFWTVVGFSHIEEKTRTAFWDVRCTKCNEVYKVRASSWGRSEMCKKCANQTNEAIRLRPFEALYRLAERSARKAGHVFTLTYEEFLKIVIEAQCHYCWTPITFAEYCASTTGHEYQIGCKDADKGYVSGNVVACCSKCHQTKQRGSYSYETWLGMASALRPVSQSA